MVAVGVLVRTEVTVLGVMVGLVMAMTALMLTQWWRSCRGGDGDGGGAASPGGGGSSCGGRGSQQ